MALYTKCIFDPPQPEDGIRISVMSRHTLEDGKTIDARITPASYHQHMPKLGPPPKVIGAYYRTRETKDPETRWLAFQEVYLAYIQRDQIVPLVKGLAQQAIHNDITLLCVECLDPQGELKCHRKILADQCKTYEPALLIEHR